MAGVVHRCGKEIFRLLALEGGDLRAQNPSYDPVGIKDDAVNAGNRDSFAATAPLPTKPPLSLRGSALGSVLPFGDTARTLQPVTPLGLSLGDWITTSGNRSGVSKPDATMTALDGELREDFRRFAAVLL